MVAPIQQRVTVQPGGRIEFSSPDLQAGQTACVIVLPDEPQLRPVRWSDFIGSGKGMFKDIDEIDRYIRELRDEWER